MASEGTTIYCDRCRWFLKQCDLLQSVANLWPLFGTARTEAERWKGTGQMILCCWLCTAMINARNPC